MRNLFITLAILATALPACTKLNAGDTFNASANGNEFCFEVIVSRMTYVKASPAAGTAAIKGSLKIPAKVEYDGTSYMVTEIADHAFEGFTGLTSVTLPATLSTIGDCAFKGCTALQEINTPQPLSVIGDYAFAGCMALRSFDFEASLSKIGKGAFRACASLEAVKFTPSFTAIPNECFFGCVSIKELDLPSTIMEIGSDAFGECTGLTSVKMERSVQTIGAAAFANCSCIGAITCLTATPPACGKGVFDGIETSIPVTVPMADVASYKTAAGWSRFTNIAGKY